MSSGGKTTVAVERSDLCTLQMSQKSIQRYAYESSVEKTNGRQPAVHKSIRYATQFRKTEKAECHKLNAIRGRVTIKIFRPTLGN
jgi:hypothetical protein